MATHLGTRLYTFMQGQYVGKDEFGNRYYQQRRAPKAKLLRRRRWVIYQGQPEASKVPPSWHGWLHYTVDHPPVDGQASRQHKWQKEHLPNLTGTTARHLPKGHLERGGQRAASASDYVAWKPE